MAWVPYSIRLLMSNTTLDWTISTGLVGYTVGILSLLRAEKPSGRNTVFKESIFKRNTAQEVREHSLSVICSNRKKKRGYANN